MLQSREICEIRGYKKMTNKPIFMLKQNDVSHLPTANCLKLKAKSYSKNKPISNPFGGTSQTSNSEAQTKPSTAAGAFAGFTLRGYEPRYPPRL